MPKGTGRSARTQASDLGHKGGKVGGKARARKLNTQQRSAIARKGAQAKNANNNKGSK